MNLLNKLTIKNLSLNKKRTIVTVIGIMLSVALITAVASVYSSTIDSLIGFETYQRGNFHVAFYNVPTKDIEIFKNNREVEDIYLTKNIGFADLKNSQNPNKPYAFVKAFTKDSFENLSVRLVEGRLPENDDEIVIPTHLKTNGRITLNVGENITLNIGKRVGLDGVELNQNNPFQRSETSLEKTDSKTGESSEKIIDTTTKTYKIVGIIERPASNIEEYSAPGYTFITYANENDFSGNVDVYAKYTKSGIKNYLKVTANILQVDESAFEKLNTGEKLSKEEFEKLSVEMSKAKYGYTGNEYLILLETNPLDDSAIGGLGSAVIVVCVIIVFTSVFCIKNSFDISIIEKIKQYGMLRSIGATKKQIRKNVFYEATILGLIGIPLGISLGFLASYILIIISNYFMKDMINLDLHFAFSWVSVIAAVLLGIVTIYLSAIRSARKASKISPIDSIRNSSSIKIKAKKVRSPKIIKKLFGMGGDISYKNLKRNKKKYRTTVISIVVSVAVFIGLYSFMSMAFVSIENELSLQDYNLGLSIDANKNEFQKVLETTKLDNIEDFTVYRCDEVVLNNANYNDEYKKLIGNTEILIRDEEDKMQEVRYITICAIGEEQYKKYISSFGLDYEDIKDKAILFDNIKFNIYDEEKSETNKYQIRAYIYKNGDKLDVILSNHKNINLEIGYVADKVPFGLKNHENSAMIILSDEMFEKYVNTERVNIFYQSNDAGKLQDDIDETLKDLDYYLTNSEENARMMNNLFTLIGIFLYGFIIVISLIGITNIFNTITTNMELRKPEFAMLKSVGMTKQEFNKMIRLESIFMGVKSLAFGIPIGIVISYLIYRSLGEGSGMNYKLPIVAIVSAIIAVFLLITLIMKYSMGKINKQNTIETIRNENI